MKDKEKKIAILVKNLASGGAEKQAILLAKTLSSNYEVHFIILDGTIYDNKLLLWIKEDDSIHIEYLYGNRFGKLKSLRRYLSSANISHLFCYLTGANFYGTLATWKSKSPKVYSGVRNARLPFIKLIIDRLLTNHFVSKVILNSYSADEYFSRKGFNPKKIVVIPNCFENISIPIERTKKEQVRIITVARFVPQKDYYTALEVIAKLINIRQDIIYQIIGYGEEEAKIRGWIKSLKLEPFVEIHIKPDNIEELLIGADIYFSTSLFEGTSNSIMEAMNASLPIVATNVGDNNQLVKDGVNGYIVDAKDSTQMTHKIERLLSDLSLRNTMGLQSNNILKNNYSKDSFENQYRELIETDI